VDPATNCLHLKVMDWGSPGQPLSKSFARDGMALEETVRGQKTMDVQTGTQANIHTR
jgi:hypothetical protein